MKQGSAAVCALWVSLCLLTGCFHMEIDDSSTTVSRSATENTSLSSRESTVADPLPSLPTLCQYPELPTGCEATAAAMVLQFYGETVSPAEVAGEWLSCDNFFLDVEGVLYGPDPQAVFVGDPFSAYAYGCFAPVIVEAVQTHSTVCTAHTVTADTLEILCRDYADKGIPLLIWATTDMKPVQAGGHWKLSDGTDFVWPAGEHCLVLTGCTEDSFRFHDPGSGTAVTYEKALCESRFQELGQQAVLIEPR